jgi:probable rRNA maturation factor
MITAYAKKAPADFSALYRAVEEELGITERYSVELLFVGEKRIKDTNREFRGVDRVTDILSFPTTETKAGDLPTAKENPFEVDEEGNLFLGSLMVCNKRVKAQAKEYGHSEERELNYLLCHGLLHLLGYDHMVEEDKRMMRAKEEAVMARMNLTR